MRHEDVHEVLKAVENSLQRILQLHADLPDDARSALTTIVIQMQRVTRIS